MSQSRARTNKPASERRAEILDHAQRLFLQQGYDCTSVNDLIQALGLSKGAFYHHFESKQAVLEALTDRMLAGYEPTMCALLDDPGLSALEKWQRLMSSSNQWKLEHKEALLMQLSAMHNSANLLLKTSLTNKSRAIGVPLFSRLLAQGVAEGCFELADPAQTAHFLFALMDAQSDQLTQYLLYPERFDDPAGASFALLCASQQAIERLLAAPVGSLPLIDRDAIDAWFN
ncbi:TetR/AcrR family transcriptional regulator [Ferrimonas pelagia]|uniref:TetR/AcrR family transcriptional regulator n=1 Tax=Ferrimonas pelagia TaxID=1177826 RepID=A0ABP9EFU1_9GAMM